MKEYEHVHVVLDGYDRYGRAFIDEAFGGLIYFSEFTLDYLTEHLSYSHESVPVIYWSN